MTPLRSITGFFALSLLFSANLSAQVAAIDNGGTGTLVKDADGEGCELLRIEDSSRQAIWLEFDPSVLQARGSGGSLVAVAGQPDREDLRVAVVTSDDNIWQPNDDVMAVELSHDGRYVLTHSLRKDAAGQPQASRIVVYGGKGEVVRELELPAGSEDVAEFSQADDALLIYGDGHDGAPTLRLLRLHDGSEEVRRLPAGSLLEEARALNDEAVFSILNGALHLHRFSGPQTPDKGWILRPDPPLYSSIRGISTRLRAVLVARGFGLYDVVDQNGKILHPLELTDDLQPMLLDNGDLEIVSSDSTWRRIIRWPYRSGNQQEYDSRNKVVGPDRRFALDLETEKVNRLTLRPVARGSAENPTALPG